MSLVALNPNQHTTPSCNSEHLEKFANRTILVVEDEHFPRKLFQDDPTINLQFTAAQQAVFAIAEGNADVLVICENSPSDSILETLHAIRESDPKLPIVFITSNDSSDVAIEVMKQGASDVISQSTSQDQLENILRKSIESRRLMQVAVGFEMEFTDDEGDSLIGVSAPMQEVYKNIGRVAPQEVAVLIRGESGTGKELVARALYHFSERANRPFLAVNCAALSDTLLESELFGHEKGAFTGATSRRIGKFEQCHRGTIFLDEVGDMSPLVQSKVLRLLQDQRFERVGGNETIHTDVRIISATNRSLEDMIEAGEFRNDLFYRLNGFSIHLPPLREREEDLKLLIEYFLARIGNELKKEDNVTITEQAMQFLLNYSWPGNIRQLQSVIRHALLLNSSNTVLADSLPDMIKSQKNVVMQVANSQVERASDTESLKMRSPADGFQRYLEAFLEDEMTTDPKDLYSKSLELMERCLLRRVLKKSKGNKSKAAQLLGITRGSLRHKIKSLNLNSYPLE